MSIKLLDLKELKNYNSIVKNGMDSVTNKKVFFGKNDWMPDFALETVCCLEHGAMLCVARIEQGTLWRCPTCNEGCIKTEVRNNE